MKASELLGALDSAALRVRLLPILPEQVVVRPLEGPWGYLFPAWTAAVTMPWGIYVRRGILQGDPGRLARLLVHELVHSRQWRTHGPIGFVSRYLRDYLRGRLRGLRHRDAYSLIGLEAEAYELSPSTTLL